MANEPLTILTIDDDLDFATAIRLQLQRAFNVRVLTANDALSAMCQLQNDPDLVICDVKMPTANGLGILELMDANPRWRETPVVVLTGCSDGNTLRRVGRLAAHYVPKGRHTWPSLSRVVDELLIVARERSGHTMAVAPWHQLAAKLTS